MKLNALLAKLELSGSQFAQLLKDYVDRFTKFGNLFKGQKQTYQKHDPYLDEPNRRGHTMVQNTVEGDLQYLEDTCEPHISNLFDVEATNASGKARAHLIVEGKDFGEFSSLELLRLKTFLNRPELHAVYSKLPVRDVAQNWKPTTEEDYKTKNAVWETPMFSSMNRTTVKESYILTDPNLAHLKERAQYTPQLSSKDTQVVMGEQTVQYFSGEISHMDRAEILRRLSVLKQAVQLALSVANEATVIQSEITGAKIFNYLHKGAI